MTHFATCTSYRNIPCQDWTNIYGSDSLVMTKIALDIEKRVEERKSLIEKAEVGQTQKADSTAPGHC